MGKPLRQGRLFYVIGPSAAGKDSVLRGARTRLEGREPIIFARRYITRPRDAGGEDHIPVTPDEFADRLRGAGFLFNWESHGHRYGIGREVGAWLARGFDVAVNGSRGYLDEARRRVPDLIAVSIRVSPEQLRHRLERRGRESGKEIRRRLARAAAFRLPEGAVVIDNDGPLERAVEAFCRLVRGRRPHTAART